MLRVENTDNPPVDLNVLPHSRVLETQKNEHTKAVAAGVIGSAGIRTSEASVERNPFAIESPLAVLVKLAGCKTLP